MTFIDLDQFDKNRLKRALGWGGALTPAEKIRLHYDYKKGTATVVFTVFAESQLVVRLAPEYMSHTFYEVRDQTALRWKLVYAGHGLERKVLARSADNKILVRTDTSILTEKERREHKAWLGKLARRLNGQLAIIAAKNRKDPKPTDYDLFLARRTIYRASRSKMRSARNDGGASAPRLG